MAHESLTLAYDAVVLRLQQQDASLGRLRDRASALLVPAGLVASFPVGIGLLATKHSDGRTLPTFISIALTVLLMLTILTVLRVNWRVRAWGYGPSAAVILQLHDEGKDPDQVLREMVDRLLVARDGNDERLVGRARWYRIGVALFAAEMFTVLLGVLLAK
ncbi:hypothetical protein [Angustibacter luteus]|uniref:Uncharacterized protein n=1 Tax=Angustibacter luteus TaxID=658456 RepID=A0ABW1JGN5_9ACTN